jgi:hypothetical protein
MLWIEAETETYRCIRLHTFQRKMAAWRRRRSPRHRPEQLAGNGKSRLRVLSPQDCELPANCQIFQEQIVARWKESSIKSGQKSRQAQHEASFTRKQAKIDV